MHINEISVHTNEVRTTYNIVLYANIYIDVCISLSLSVCVCVCVCVCVVDYEINANYCAKTKMRHEINASLWSPTSN